MDVITKVRDQGLRIAYVEKTGKVLVEPADRLTDELRAEIGARRAEIVAALVAETGSVEQAWALLGVSDTAHVAVLVAGLSEEDAEPIRSALTRGLALLAAHEGPVPTPWLERMQEIHRTALGLHRARVGGRSALYQVLAAVPHRGGDWLGKGLALVDVAGWAKNETGLDRASDDVIDAAVRAWVLDGDAPTEGSP